MGYSKQTRRVRDKHRNASLTSKEVTKTAVGMGRAKHGKEYSLWVMMVEEESRNKLCVKTFIITPPTGHVAHSLQS